MYLICEAAVLASSLLCQTAATNMTNKKTQASMGAKHAVPKP